MSRLYLDHNATSPLRPECRAAMIDAMDAPRNPSSVHAEGRAAKRIVEDARTALAGMVGAVRESVVFTGGGTEAIATAILGLVRGGPRVERVLVSTVEHAATSAMAAQAGVPVEVVPVTREGVVDLAALERMVADDAPFLLCLMLANNETGVIQPVTEAARIVRAAGGYVLCDAVQALGKLPLDFASLGADLMVLAGHKAGGPVGAGALVVTPGLAFQPLLQGGGQEERRRAGTHDVAAIAGLGALARVATPDAYARLAPMRDAMQAGLPEGITVWGERAERLPNTLCFSAPGFASDAQVMTMDLAGIAVSAGSACSSGKVRRSGVLAAMGATDDEGASAVRVSLGWDTPKDAPARFLAAWTREHARVSGRRAA